MLPRLLAALALALAACRPPPPRTEPASPPAAVAELPEGDAPVEEGPELVSVPAGVFWMGSDAGAKSDGPRHQVTLSAFEIDRLEVSAAAYARCVEAKACTPAGSGGLCTAGAPALLEHPINCVTWKQAAAYCAHAGKRLPTEAEWERAARGDDGRTYVWGEAWPPARGAGNFADLTAQARAAHWSAVPGYDDGFATTAPAGSLRGAAAPSGALDMAGNVMEWTADWWDPKAYGAKERQDPTGPKRGLARVVRGSSFGQSRPEQIAVTARGYYAEDVASAHIGFRCAKDAAPPPPPPP